MVRNDSGYVGPHFEQLPCPLGMNRFTLKFSSPGWVITAPMIVFRKASSRGYCQTGASQSVSKSERLEQGKNRES